MSDATEQIRTSRTIAAPASAIFAVLRDPARHPETEPGDWVREAIDPEPITSVGQVFGMHMDHEQAVGGAYVMHNRVTELEPHRVICWEPGQLDDADQLDVGGWTWRYDLLPVPGGTDVTLTYDWSAVPATTREEFGGELPPFPTSLFDESLAALERAVLNDVRSARG